MQIRQGRAGTLETDDGRITGIMIEDSSFNPSTLPLNMQSLIFRHNSDIKWHIPLTFSLVVVLCDVAGGGDQPGGLRLSLDPD